MSEKENMLAGLFYNSLDPELVRLRQEARRTLWQYNATDPADESKRRELMEKLFGQAGKNLIIEPPFYCDYGYNICIGDNFFSNTNLMILDGAKVTIGNNVFIAPNVGIYTAGHPVNYQQRNAGLEYAYPVTIGNNVWIGAQVCILPGITIGDNTIIGGGSVVTKDIPSGVIAAGNPCRIIREITQKDESL